MNRKIPAGRFRPWADADAGNDDERSSAASHNPIKGGTTSSPADDCVAADCDLVAGSNERRTAMEHSTTNELSFDESAAGGRWRWRRMCCRIFIVSPPQQMEFGDGATSRRRPSDLAWLAKGRLGVPQRGKSQMQPHQSPGDAEGDTSYLIFSLGRPRIDCVGTE